MWIICFYYLCCSETDQSKKKNKKRRKKVRDSKYSSGDSDGMVGHMDSEEQDVCEKIEDLKLDSCKPSSSLTKVPAPTPSSSLTKVPAPTPHEHGPCCNHGDGHSHHNGGLDGMKPHLSVCVYIPSHINFSRTYTIGIF